MHTVFEILCNTEKLREKYSSSALIRHKRKAFEAFNFLCAMHRRQEHFRKKTSRWGKIL